MSSHSFVKAKSNWVGSVKYKPPTVDTRGGKAVKLIHNSQWLTLQIPLMFTWGVNEFVDENSNGEYDEGEEFTETNENGIWDDAEEFVDELNGV